MIKGFVTIATGKEQYYILARNLLRSYRDNCENPMRFAVIADQENEYTKEFDDIVILKKPSRSWMDKMEILKVCPYDENIFIDADCLIYKNINFLWDIFNEADDFSCFGQELPLDSQEGWFTQDVAKRYRIHFITHLHGIMYFVRPGSKIDEMYSLCKKIISDYHSINFSAFNDVLADEPVFALAMSVMNFHPVERKKEYYCFVPFANWIRTNYINRTVSFKNPKDGTVRNCCIVHWGHGNTLLARYKSDSQKLNYYYREPLSWKDKIKGWVLYKINLFYFICVVSDRFCSAKKGLCWFVERVQVKITRVLSGDNK